MGEELQTCDYDLLMYMSGTHEYYFLILPGSLLPSGGKLSGIKRTPPALFPRRLETLTKDVFQPLSRTMSKTKASRGLDPGS